MDLSTNPAASTATPHLFNEEDLTRLCKQLGREYQMHTLTGDEQSVVLKTLVNGLQSMPQNAATVWWAEVFAQIIATARDWPVAGAAGEKTVMRVLLAQPAPSRSLLEQKRLRAIGAYAVLLKTLQLHTESAAFVHGMAQIFRSSKPDWTSLSQVDLFDSNALLAWEPPPNASVAATDFRDQLVRLIRISLPTPGAFQNAAASSNAKAVVTVNSAARAADDATPSHSARGAARVLDASPHLTLFELQTKHDTAPELVDGYRLKLNWARLTPGELKTVLNKLNADLAWSDSEIAGRQRRAHAFGRYLSLFAGLSLRACWGLPLRRKGSMFYDIKQGVLRRDALVAAPRSDKGGKPRTRGRCWRTRLPMEVATAGRSLLARHPSARTLGELLTLEGLSYQQCQILLNEGCETSHKPEDTRFAKSLRPCLLALNIHPAVVARTTGDWMTTPSTDHYYLLLTESQTHQAVAKFCEWAGLTPPPPPTRDREIGSPHAPTVAQFKSAVEALNQQVLVARNKLTTRSPIGAVVDFHNLYTKAVALQLIWATGGRGNNFSSLTFGHLFSADDYLLFSDRRVDPYAQHRICPSTRALNATRRHYIEHLTAMRAVLERVQGGELNGVFSSAHAEAEARPAFHLICPNGSGWTARALERHDLVALAHELGMAELNSVRHFWFTQLVRLEVAQVAIDALLGHEIQRAEPFGYGSGVSPRELFNYLRPILEQVQNELGFMALVGRGRQAQRFLALPAIPVATTLAPIPNTRLLEKLKAQDTLVPDLHVVHQDPPVASHTLIAHTYLTRLRRAFLDEPVVSRWPLGAFLFCLIVREIVIAPAEQEDLFNAALGDGAWSADAMPVIESQANGRPIGQRILDRYSLGALKRARDRPTVGLNSFSDARKQLHQLLKALDSEWPATQATQSQMLLSNLTNHWSAVEVAPGTLFGVVHKAPFIPIEDLARLNFKRPSMTEKTRANSDRLSISRRDTTFNDLQDLVNRWADKDERLGDEQARQVGCATELRSRLEEVPMDATERLLTELLLADLSDAPPYRKLKVTSLPEYLRGYRVFFLQVREEGIVEFDAETMRWIYQKMGGLPDINQSCPARWQMLHISAFFSSKGIQLTFGVFAGKGKKIPLPPRIPVYVSRMEFSAVSDALADAAAAQGLGAVAAAAQMKVRRSALTRKGELRYLATADLDSKAGLIHITSTGHAHLKNKSSRGSVPLDDKLIQELEALRRRQNSLDCSPRKSLFADDQRRDGYSILDDITDLATASVVALTGCDSFRPHDLRAAGATDTALEVEAILQRLCAGNPVQQPNQTASSVTMRSARFALASRLARHASSLTTLRYYYCGGYLDLREQLDQATASEAPSGLFVADLLSLQPQTLYAKAHRLNGDSKIGSDWKNFPVLQSFFLHATASLPTPWLGEPQQTIQIEPLVALPTGEKMSAVHGALASFVGLSRRAAADRFDADERAVDRIAVATAAQAANLGITLNWADERAPLIGRAIAHTEKGAGQVMHRLAALMVEHPQWLQVHRPALLTCFHPDGTCLVVRTLSQLQSMLPVLRQLQAAGLLPIVRFGTRAAPDEVSHFIRNGLLAGFARHPTNSQKDWSASIQFVLCDSSGNESRAPQPAPRTSARTLGRVGRLAVAALLLSLALLDLIPLEKNHA